MPRVVAVNRAVSDLAPLLRRSLGERVRLQLMLEEPERAVRVDPGQLDQVLVNLAVNARDAMPDGGTLTLRTRRRTLLAPRRTGTETIPPGRYVSIEVQDTGTGIPPDILPRIFEPFFTTRPSGGTGLGLSTVVGIVRQSGGFLEVETAPGQGSLFRILLPRSGEAPAPAIPPAAAPVQATPTLAARGTVLLVEDEDAVRRLAERALQRRGWHVLSADCGEAALALLVPGQALACVVTDMVMPGMDGAALVMELRHRLARPDLPAIIASGYAEVLRHDAIGTAATAFLPKPYALRDLTDRVAALAAGDPAVAPA
jgi:two-component system cell cycle sensor histidine kinase/response regulator CckA